MADTQLILPASVRDDPSSSVSGFAPDDELRALQERLVSDEPDLLFRDSKNPHEWMPLTDEDAARRVVESLGPDNFWCTISRTTWDYGHDTWKYSVFEALTDTNGSGRFYMCGDVNAGDDACWYWSSWPDTNHDEPQVKTTVGPPGFQASIWEQQCLTLDDVLGQLRYGLRATPQVTHQAPGFVWLTRHLHDASLNTHIRSPIGKRILN